MTGFRLTAGTLLVQSSPGDDETLSQQIAWLNDPEVVKYSEQRHCIHTLENQRAYWTSFSGNHSNLFLAIYVGGEMIGTMNVYGDTCNGVANVGIMIGDRSKWGLGYGSDAWEAVCQYLLAHSYRKVEAGCMAINKPMMSICQHYGMIEEGRQKDHFLVNGKATDLIHWGKFR